MGATKSPKRRSYIDCSLVFLCQEAEIFSGDQCGPCLIFVPLLHLFQPLLFLVSWLVAFLFNFLCPVHWLMMASCTVSHKSSPLVVVLQAFVHQRLHEPAIC